MGWKDRTECDVRFTGCACLSANILYNSCQPELKWLKLKATRTYSVRDLQVLHMKSLFPGLHHTFPRQSYSPPPKTHRHLPLSHLSSHNPATMHSSVLFPSILTLFITSAAASTHCITTSTTTASCYNGGRTETDFGTATETATISVDCHGCETLTYSTIFHPCPVSVACLQNGTICHIHTSEETDVLIATPVGVYRRTPNYRDRSHFCDYNHRLQQDPAVNSISTWHIWAMRRKGRVGSS